MHVACPCVCAGIETLPTPLSLFLQIFAALPPATRIQRSFKSGLTRQNEDDQHAVTPRLGEEGEKKQRAGLIVDNDGDRRWRVMSLSDRPINCWLVSTFTPGGWAWCAVEPQMSFEPTFRSDASLLEFSKHDHCYLKLHSSDGRKRAQHERPSVADGPSALVVFCLGGAVGM